ncbi:uncharacterized protein ATC70_007335 [Mucor velutinosus]|uniref:Endonuclease/exonuclease/phosphatase domain-containing protein n=1 Tax=Mucor velutinosus TaxID=708070 RepID=A0AAN7DS52_9FUNG|nr:hypothetical protein ATC70_007335 [Mucor velutinosus]
MTRDTILCGDFNARLGSLTGDAISNARGNALKPWFDEHCLSVLNASLAFGVTTYSSFRQQQELSSIIDLFLTNIGDVALVNPQLVVESDLSLGSDHRLMSLTFGYVPPLDDTVAPGDFCSGSSASMEALEIDEREAFGLTPSIGVKSGRPGHWKKYWTQEIQDAATVRDHSYSQWRHAFGIVKVEKWSLYKIAHRKFRSLVQAAKRRSWKQFCGILEKDFSKATAAIKRIKRNKESSATYSHPDGPAASVTAMGSHLASVL